MARHWMPGAAFVPQERGPEFLAIVDGAEWSAGAGFYRGFFSAFRIGAGRDVWFHVPIPAPVELEGRQMALNDVSLLFETTEGASLSWVVVQHGGMERIPLTERMAVHPSEPVPFEPPELWREYYPQCERRLLELDVRPRVPLSFGVQLSVMVTASSAEGTVRFFGAGAGYSDVH